MIALGMHAPALDLPTQFNGGRWRLADRMGRANVLILGYPLDWTPICGSELPELNRMMDDFARLADTEVVSLSSDTWQSHLAWSNSMREPIKFPMLSDSNPHGAMSQALGLWIPDEGITQRGTVIVDKNGRVAFHQIAGKDNRRSLPALLEAAVRVNGGMKPGMSMPQPTQGASCDAGTCDIPAPAGRAAGQAAKPKATIFVKSTCGACMALKSRLNGMAGWRDVADMVVVDEGNGMQIAMRLAPGLRAVPAIVANGQVERGVDDVLAKVRALMGKK